MIFVSSTCIRTSRIGDAVKTLAGAGFREIELSGGTRWYSGWEEELLALKREFGLTYLVHNYFPPAKEDILLNLASGRKQLFEKSLDFYLRALETCHRLGSPRYGLHAGMRFDPSPRELGGRLSRSPLRPPEEARDRFFTGLQRLEAAAGSIQLYVENHVLSPENLRVFEGANPLMLTTSADYRDLRRRGSFTILLDLAHLAVSCTALDLNFGDEAAALIGETDYIHLSGTDGRYDGNDPLLPDSPVLRPLAGIDLTSYTVTLEVYGGVDALARSRDALPRLT
ncbi:TIM barrel protein [bacterium]|nr:TIM barrel protein [bacterium]